ncbi:phage tail sheath C-terminal domain-containing protein [Pseudomonas sp. R5(2019)]|uniref:phage tail sheath C-terminal domain-containing protein n=1 Tax=Pseudomonas sp. R5(2019) TaxID=2697566 RepID=UPI001412608A|nr:phage tail sheath C-terminal domain-containing protein [Pseudomonas sp. R5(2019)]NBA93498.1 phage tail sheath family protein [Pseudomonas sp. R5(2019)]
MPSALTYPGVYVEEIPSGVRTITAVPTSVTAFIGRARKGPINEAIEINSYGDFERTFGGLWVGSTMCFAVRDFYLNGGSRAVIVRLTSPCYPNAQARRNAEAAAKKIADAAAAKENGKEAIAAADAENKLLQNDDDAKPEEKQAADAALDTIKNSLTNDAKKEDIEAIIKKVRSSTVRTIEIGALRLEAKSPGKWAADLRVEIERPYDTTPKVAVATVSAREAAKKLNVEVDTLFTLTVTDTGPGGSTETFTNVTFVDSPRRVDHVLKEQSRLIKWPDPEPVSITTQLDHIVKLEQGAPPRNGDSVTNATLELSRKKAESPDPKTWKNELETLQDALDDARSSVNDGVDLDTISFLPEQAQANKKGLYALEQLFTRGGIFNLLCIPPNSADQSINAGVLAAAVSYAEFRRAMVIVDPPATWEEVEDARKKFGEDSDNLPRSKNAAVFFPRIKQPNPLSDNRLESFAPCGVIAGIFARTDTQRGVWKAPAGLDASLVGVSKLHVAMTDEDNGLLNPLGINCLRNFPVFGKVVWGARTLRGADDYADEYKYIPVRRTALFIEESLYRGLKWVVFEPNDEPLWAQIRLNVGAFMHNLFRQGAFQGASKREAYFVKCDAETTTQNDINLGTVNIHVGFAPLKPAEFVVIKLQQMIGQIET